MSGSTGTKSSERVSLTELVNRGTHGDDKIKALENLESNMDKEKAMKTIPSLNGAPISLSGATIISRNGFIDLYELGIVKSDEVLTHVSIDRVLERGGSEYIDIDNSTVFSTRSVQLAKIDADEGTLLFTGDFYRVDDIIMSVGTKKYESKEESYADGFTDSRGKYNSKVSGFVKSNIITAINGDQRVMTEEEEILVYGIAGTYGIDADEMKNISDGANKSIVMAAAGAGALVGMNAEESGKKANVSTEAHDIVIEKKSDTEIGFKSSGQNKLEKHIEKKEKTTDTAISETVDKISKVRKSKTTNVKGFFKKMRDRKTSGVELYLPNSNVKLRFHSIDTTLKKTNLFYKMRSADNVSEDIDVILDILSHTTGMFADAHSIGDIELLDRIHDADMQYVYWGSFMATVGRETTDLNAPCVLDNGSVLSKDCNLMEVYMESLTDEAKKASELYDPTKTIDELQKDIAVGASYVFAKELDDVIVNITGEVPSAIRRLRLSPFIRKFIIDECADVLDDAPSSIRERLLTTSNKLEYIGKADGYRVDLISKTKIEPLISLTNIEVLDKVSGEALELSMSDLGSGLTMSDMIDTVAEINESLLTDFIEYMDEKYDVKSDSMAIEGRCRHPEHSKIAISQGIEPSKSHESVGLIEPKMYLFIMLQQRISRA